MAKHMPQNSMLSSCNMQGITVNNTEAENLLCHFPRLYKLPVHGGAFVKFRDNIIVHLPVSDSTQQVRTLDLSQRIIPQPVLGNIISVLASRNLESLDLRGVQGATLDEVLQLIVRYADRLANLRHLDLTGISQGNESRVLQLQTKIHRMLPSLHIVRVLPSNE